MTIKKFDIIEYKKKYFRDRIYVSFEDIFNHFRSIGIKEMTIDYTQPIELLKLVADKLFFYKSEVASIKNLFYQENFIYQDIKTESQVNSYLSRLINEKTNRVLVFIDDFSKKNSKKNISVESQKELINNINNDIIYLSDNILLLKNSLFLPLLWQKKDNIKEAINKLTDNNKYILSNKWDFNNE